MIYDYTNALTSSVKKVRKLPANNGKLGYSILVAEECRRREWRKHNVKHLHDVCTRMTRDDHDVSLYRHIMLYDL